MIVLLALNRHLALPVSSSHAHPTSAACSFLTSSCTWPSRLLILALVGPGVPGASSSAAPGLYASTTLSRRRCRGGVADMVDAVMAKAATGHLFTSCCGGNVSAPPMYPMEHSSTFPTRSRYSPQPQWQSRRKSGSQTRTMRLSSEWVRFLCIAADSSARGWRGGRRKRRGPGSVECVPPRLYISDLWRAGEDIRIQGVGYQGWGVRGVANSSCTLRPAA